MPIYEYNCSNCDHTVDVRHKIGSDTTLTCPECDKKLLHRIMSAPAGIDGNFWDLAIKWSDNTGDNKLYDIDELQ